MTYSIVARDRRHGRAGRGGPVALVLGRAHRSLGPARRRGGGHPGQRRGRLRAAGAGPARAAGCRRRGRSSACSPRTRWPASRQVAIVDARGEVAAHTGDACMAFAGDVQGDGVSCQANIMATAEVWPAMLDAYAGDRGSSAARLLDRARRGRGHRRRSARPPVGGDPRRPCGGEPWDTVTALRVEDHPDPLVELARLAKLDEAYRVAGEGDERLAAGRHDEASALFQRACELAPESDELRFWAGSRCRAGRGHGHGASPTCAPRSRSTPAGWSCCDGSRPSSRRRRPPCWRPSTGTRRSSLSRSGASRSGPRG